VLQIFPVDVTVGQPVAAPFVVGGGGGISCVGPAGVEPRSCEVCVAGESAVAAALG